MVELIIGSPKYLSSQSQQNTKLENTWQNSVQHWETQNCKNRPVFIISRLESLSLASRCDSCILENTTLFTFEEEGKEPKKRKKKLHYFSRNFKLTPSHHSCNETFKYRVSKKTRELQNTF